MALSSVTDSNFANDVLNSDIPVVVDFWAEWCGPCKMLAPTLEELNSDMAGKVKIVKLNIDDNNETAAQYGIRSIPTLILFKDGEAVASQSGVQPKSSLHSWIENAI